VYNAPLVSQALQSWGWPNPFPISAQARVKGGEEEQVGSGVLAAASNSTSAASRGGLATKMKLPGSVESPGLADHAASPRPGRVVLPGPNQLHNPGCFVPIP
jgi:hypothetical protein